MVKKNPTLGHPATLAKAKEEVEAIALAYPKPLMKPIEGLNDALAYVRVNNDKGRTVTHTDRSDLVGKILVLNRS